MENNTGTQELNHEEMIDHLSTLDETTFKTQKRVNLSHLVSKLTLPIDTFLSLPEVPFQRDTESHAKRKEVNDNLKTLIPEHLDVQLVELTQDCTYNGTTFNAGLYIVNGNTRRYFWKNGLSDAIPEEVFVTVYAVDSLDRMQLSYNTFDSMAAVEKNNEKLFGLFANMFGFYPKSKKLSNGQCISALNMASSFYDHKSYNQVTIKDPQMLKDQTLLWIDELRAWDEISKTPRNWDQALLAASLMALKKYGVTNKKLLEGLAFLDCRALDTKQSMWDGITHISNEWNNNTIFKIKGTKWCKEGGLQDTTSYALRCIKKYMDDETESVAENKKKGNYKNYGNNWFANKASVNPTALKVKKQKTVKNHSVDKLTETFKLQSPVNDLFTEVTQ